MSKSSKFSIVSSESDDDSRFAIKPVEPFPPPPTFRKAPKQRAESSDESDAPPPPSAKRKKTAPSQSSTPKKGPSKSKKQTLAQLHSSFDTFDTGEDDLLFSSFGAGPKTSITASTANSSVALTTPTPSILSPEPPSKAPESIKTTASTKSSKAATSSNQKQTRHEDQDWDPFGQPQDHSIKKSKVSFPSNHPSTQTLLPQPDQAPSPHDSTVVNNWGAPDFDPKNVSWKSGQHVPYAALASMFERCEATTKRLAIISYVRDFLRAVIVTSPDELLPIVYLCVNQTAPAFEGKELGIGDSTLERAVAEAVGSNPAAIKALVKECGDLGQVAEESRVKQVTLFKPKPLTCQHVLDSMRKLCYTSGQKSIDTKRALIKSLLVSAQGCETRFITRAVQGNLRIRLALSTVLRALSESIVLTPPISSYILPIPQEELVDLSPENIRYALERGMTSSSSSATASKSKSRLMKQLAAAAAASIGSDDDDEFNDFVVDHSDQEEQDEEHRNHRRSVRAQTTSGQNDDDDGDDDDEDNNDGDDDHDDESIKPVISKDVPDNHPVTSPQHDGFDLDNTVWDGSLSTFDSGKTGLTPLQTKLLWAHVIVEGAYNEGPSLERLIPALLQYPLSHLKDRCMLTPLLPIKVMLGKPGSSVEFAIKKLAPNYTPPSVADSSVDDPALKSLFPDQSAITSPAADPMITATPTEESLLNVERANNTSDPAVGSKGQEWLIKAYGHEPNATEGLTWEYKYDGERAQIHMAEDGKIAVFSRHMENYTSKYPDVISAMPSCIAPGTKSFIIDSEVVAWDPIKQRILPFQVLSTRKRKDVDVHSITVQIRIFPFDMLFYNGSSLLKQPFHVRRNLLHKAFSCDGTIMSFATHINSMKSSLISSFLQHSVSSCCEGLMAKALNGPISYYVPDKRKWVKIKKDYMEGVGDTVDLVILAAWYGKGKRAGLYGSFLTFSYDPSEDSYCSMTSVSTGFSDSDLASVHATLQDAIISPSEAKNYVWSNNTTDPPDVWFSPKLVAELKCADLTVSPEYYTAYGQVHDSKGQQAGISMRFPRFLRLRDDKVVTAATTPDQILDMYYNQSYSK